jgi:curved DNA-binding protein
MSYYDTLGVDKTATQDQIKKAYRKLSMEHHPDKTGGDDTKFKEINEAYETLSDANKRKQYDMRGWSYSGNPFAWDSRQAYDPFGNFGNMSDMFNDMFGGFGFGKQSSKGPDYQVDMHISFEEAFKGTSKSINVNGENVNLTFKPGLRNGQKFRMQGKGAPHQFNSNLPNGDLVINIHVIQDARFILQGNDIWIDVYLPWWDLVLGTTVVVDSVEGPISIKIPESSSSEKTLRVKDKGFPIYNTNQRGYLMCKLRAIFPELNDSQKDLLRTIRDIENARRDI